MAKKDNAASPPAERELVLTRIFDSPRERVFKMWTDPKHMARWWGPRGFTNPVCELDAREGGAILINMRAPDGTVYPMAGVFMEIVEPERLVFTALPLGKDGKPMFEVLNTVTFTEEDGKTTQTLRARVVRSGPEAPQHLQGMKEGWTQSLVRLSGLLREVPPGPPMNAPLAAAGESARQIVLSRIFDAPRELVWQAMTDPLHVVQWWGPRGFTTTIETMDVRPGGVWKHVMHGPDGTDYANRSVFKEVVKPERIVYAHGGGKKGEPGVEFEAPWTFAPAGEGRTEVTLRMIFPTAGDRDRIVEQYGAIEGGKQTLARLAEHLPGMSSGTE